MNNHVRILVVDDDEAILYAFRQLIKKEGYICQTARNGREALEKATQESPDVIIMDITMPELNGLEALKEIKQIKHDVPVILITGQGTMQTAIKAMKLGAFEYLIKPLSVEKVRDLIRQALKSRNESLKWTVSLEADITDRYQLIGDSPPMHEVYKLIGSISSTSNQTAVLILGESGTGKELVARAIHRNSQLPDQPFVPINCTALPENLLESELFGHEKGAFTGATERKPGKFEIAKNGSIFMDEIGDLSLQLQQKLLRVLQEREFERLGGNSVIKVNARFVAATNQPLDEMIKDGKFREDLFFRLNVATIQIPPLRDHKSDIPLLAEYFLQRYNIQVKKSIKGFTDEAMNLLMTYSFPGNIRELENIIQRAVIMTRSEVIIPNVLTETTIPAGKNDALFTFGSPVFSEARDHILNLFEKQFIEKKLKAHNGNVSAAARDSKMSRQNFHRLMIKHRIQKGE